MKHTLKIYVLLAATGIITLFASCDKVKELIDPAYGDEVLVKLMTEGGRWKIDSLVKKKEEQRRIISDSVFVNFGEFEFLSPKDTKNPGTSLGLGYLIRHFKNAAGTAVTDTTVWYPGNRNAVESVEDLGKRMTIYYSSDTRNGYTIGADQHIFDFVKKEQQLVIIEGWLRANLSNGAEVGSFRRYRLSR